MDCNKLGEDPRIKLIRPDNLADYKIYESDFNDLYDKYFKDFIIASEYMAAPSGVLDSYSDACEYIPPMVINSSYATNYIIDDNYMSIDVKTNAYNIMCEREQCDINFDELTICPSVSHATGIIMIMLKQLGINKIFCAAPAYFSIVEQALYLGFDVHLVHGSLGNNYEINTEYMIGNLPKDEPYILFLFNPWYPIGLNLRREYLEEILEHLDENAHIIIDEAQDRSYPSLLAGVQNKTSAKVYRVFGIFKGLGLHGAKAALTLHPKEYRKPITEMSETIGGTLDKYSASLLSFLSGNKDSYLMAIKAADEQINRNHRILISIFNGSQISTFPVENGFLGSIIVHLGAQNYFEFREKMLDECRNKKMPLAIGSTQFFPYSGSDELIRINYYQRQSNFEKSILLLNSCLSNSML